MRGLSPVVASGGHSSSWCAGLSLSRPLVAEHRLQTRRLSSCGSRAQSLCGMWDLPGPGFEPMSPASAGRLSSTAPPGKPLYAFYLLILPYSCFTALSKTSNTTMNKSGENRYLCFIPSPRAGRNSLLLELFFFCLFCLPLLVFLNCYLLQLQVWNIQNRMKAQGTDDHVIPMANEIPNLAAFLFPFSEHPNICFI